MNLKETLEEVEGALVENGGNGVIVIKKSQAEGRNKKLVDGLNDYLKKTGYDTIVNEDDEEYYLHAY